MLESLKVFLPISGFSLVVLFSQVICVVLPNKKIFAQRDLLISCSLILLNSFLLLFFNLGFSEFEINSYFGNLGLIFILGLESLLLLYFLEVYLFALGFLLCLLAYNSCLYQSQIFSLYLFDGFTLILSSASLFSLFFVSKFLKNEKSFDQT